MGKPELGPQAWDKARVWGSQTLVHLGAPASPLCDCPLLGRGRLGGSRGWEHREASTGELGCSAVGEGLL